MYDSTPVISSTSRTMRVVAMSLLVALLLPSPTSILLYAEELPPPEDVSSDIPAVIVTGDAVSGTELESIVNTNDVTTGTIDTEEVIADELEGDVDDETPQELCGEEACENSVESEVLSDEVGEIVAEPESALEPDGTDTEDDGVIEDEPGEEDADVSLVNDATVGNDAVVEAETGDNTATGTDSLIVTGDAIAYANVVNLVNTNIVNSEGFIGFFNEVLGINPVDLRDAFDDVFTPAETALSTPACYESLCGDASPFEVVTSNTTTITNDIIVRAESGGNTAGDGGLIATGDAYAAANILNIANTNIIDSRYLLIAFNNFGDYAGDIVLPSGSLLTSLFTAGGIPFAGGTTAIDNSAIVDTTLEVVAETGGNEAEGGVIVTGDAYAEGTVQNTVNTTEVGGNDFLLVLRVHGDWTGNMFSLPEGIEWMETDGGIVLYRSGDASGGVTDLFTTQTNSADIKNNVKVFALSGDNKVGEGGAIETGDAYASANVTNVANTSIVGENWALLIFDIFGNWNGNLSFGKPDLWIGGQATLDTTPAIPGTGVTYTYTITNNGDAPATDVRLQQRFNGTELQYISDAHRVTTGSEGMHGLWDIGDLAPGETTTVSFTTRVHPDLDRSLRAIATEAIVRSYEPDADDTDNTEHLSIYSGKNSSSRSGGGSKKANVEIQKEASADVVPAGGDVTYTVTFTNTGGAVYKALLRDVMKDADGATTSEQYWDLGTVHAGETITVSYTTKFSDTADGFYTNTAQVLGLHRHSSWRNGISYASAVAEHTIFVGDAVLGVSTTKVCEPYLRTYMRYGANNDGAEVEKLQAFLNLHMDAGINVSSTFDLATEVAVRAFQRKYADDVLYPWGLTRDSGIVYYTTQKKINELYCADAREFPLSALQDNEIRTTRARLGMYNSLPKEDDAGLRIKPESVVATLPEEDAVLLPIPTPPQHTPTAEASEVASVAHTPDINAFLRASLQKVMRWFGSLRMW